jgi:hypothetical protein
LTNRLRSSGRKVLFLGSARASRAAIGAVTDHILKLHRDWCFDRRVRVVTEQLEIEFKVADVFDRWI